MTTTTQPQKNSSKPTNTKPLAEADYLKHIKTYITTHNEYAKLGQKFVIKFLWHSINDIGHVRVNWFNQGQTIYAEHLVQSKMFKIDADFNVTVLQD